MGDIASIYIRSLTGLERTQSHTPTVEEGGGLYGPPPPPNLVPRAFPLKNGWGGKRPWHRLVTCPLVHPKIPGAIN